MTPSPQVEREVLLTLSERQYAELGRDLETLRERLGLASNTAAIVEAVRRQASRSSK